MLALEKSIAVVRLVNDFLLNVCRYLIIVIVGLLAIILVSAVLWRYGFNSAISWAEEGSKYLMVWLAFLGTPIALRRFAHISIDLLIKILSARLQQLMHFFVSVIIMITMGIVFMKGVTFAELGARQVASSFSLSMLYMYIAVPIGAGLTCLVAFEHALQSISGVVDPARGLQTEFPQSDFG